MIQIVPLTGIGEVSEGASLAVLLAEALAVQGLILAASDIVVVTQKIVSKAEARFASLHDVEPGTEAKEIAGRVCKDPRFVALVLAESTDVVRAAPHVLITRHRLGHVMANAGIDRSNLGPGEEERVLLLPRDPDASARRIAAELEERVGAAPGVIISDSFGRPWRYGVTAVAIGAAGVPALIDRRGASDRDGRRLEVTQIAFADMIANAACLAMGEGAEGIPAALVRGCLADGPEAPATVLVRPVEEDLFR